MSYPISRTLPLKNKEHGRPYTLEEYLREKKLVEKGEDLEALSKNEIEDRISKLRDKIMEDEVQVYAGHYNWTRFRGILKSLAMTSVDLGGGRVVRLLGHFDFTPLFAPHKRDEILRLQEAGKHAEIIERLGPSVFAKVEYLHALSTAIETAQDTLEKDADLRAKAIGPESVIRVVTGEPGAGEGKATYEGLMKNIVGEFEKILLSEKHRGAIAEIIGAIAKGGK